MLISMTDMTMIMARATVKAEQATPGAALKLALVTLENLFFGVFRVLGLVIGRTWFHGARVLYIVGLAFADGYREGVKVQPRDPGPPPAPVIAGAAQLLDDDRLIDQYQTPFGVPFGPNVHASHE